jgi:6-pyruvoyltetrahydropterin/6-carboxytetrahydropterin synthase
MTGRYRLTKTVEIDAAHHLPGYPGKCERLHGHRWTITFDLIAENLDENGMVADFAELKEIAERFDHVVLNEVEPFNHPEYPPTAEHMAKFLATQVREKFKNLEMVEVEVEETPGSAVSFRAEVDW